MNIFTQTWQSKKNTALLGGGPEKIEKQKQQNKYTARERLDILLDVDSFYETDQLATSPFLENKNYTDRNYTDGVITGFGKIDGKKVAVYAQDFTLNGGSVGKHHAQKICKIMDMAAKIGCPIIGMIDSGGARINEGIHGLCGYGDIFLKNTRYSGIVPQISIIAGPCAGGAVYSPALTDFIFTTDKISNLFITGPNVIKKSLHQTISKEDLGGAKVHNQISGVAHINSATEDQTFEKVKLLLSYLPSNYLNENENFLSDFEEPEKVNLENIIPQNMNASYNIKDVINSVFDLDSFFEIQESFAQNIVIGFARIEGQVVGLVANQPYVKAGALDIDASCKAARFINFCDNFSISIISFVDVPGFLPGIDQEHNGIIRHGAKLLYAYSRATVPKITLILRKAFGGAYIVMGSKQLGADFNFALPFAQIAVLGTKSAISILHGKKLAKIENLEEKEDLQQNLEKKYEEKFLNPFTAAEYGYIDSIIEPNQIRENIKKSLDFAKNKVEILPKKKHGNTPL